MNGTVCKLGELLDGYASLEKKIQKMIYPVVNHYCNKCISRCCREEICKESIESSFLSVLIEKQRIPYDTKNGWISLSGCRLGFGRPKVCYEFFCEDILKSDLLIPAYILEIIKDFSLIGNKAYGNIHLLCIENLEIISSKKIDKMIHKICILMNKVANIRLHADRLFRATSSK